MFIACNTAMSSFICVTFWLPVHAIIAGTLWKNATQMPATIARLTGVEGNANHRRQLRRRRLRSKRP